MINFVNLHNHSSFSLLDALSSPKELLSRAKELGQSALALTDHGSFAGAWDALKASKELGVKLIIGAEFYFQDVASNHENKFRHVILLAKNQIGYSNLLTLNFKGFDNKYLFGNKVYSVIDWDLLQKYSEGVICLTSCSNGIVGQLLVQNKLDEAEKAVLRLKEIFKDDLGLEVQANNLKRNPNLHHDGLDQNFVNRQIVKLAKKHSIKVVPTSNTHYLKKEDADIHDTLLAIGSHTNIYSDFRLKYSVPDFYLKTGEEVKEFFDRYYDESFTLEMCENTVYFSNKCEFPDWIDPKFTNASGKELPSFPVKDEPDYQEFLSWKDSHEEVKNLDEDNAYLRYKCQQAIIEKNKNSKEYQDRAAEELEVLEYHGFSSYMLIVADYINWARKNDISVGEGRGCLTGKTQVLTNNGFKHLKDLKKGESVYTHTGKSKKILNTFKFEVPKETLLKIKSLQSYEDLVMTKDHEIFALKKGEKEPKWIEAKDLDKGDFLFTPKIERCIKDPEDIDLSKYSDYKVENDKLNIKVYLKDSLSIKSVAKKSKISFEALRKIKNNDFTNLNNISNLKSYLSNNGKTLNNFLNNKNYKLIKINKNIKFDNDFSYLLGRWVGDGCFHGRKKGGGISIVFNSNDKEGILKIKTYLESLGFYVCQENRKNNNTLLTVSNKAIFNLFKELFPSYTYAGDKSLPLNFRTLNNELLKSMISGLLDSDGTKTKYKLNNIKTISKTLALEIKESLTYIGLPSKIYIEKNPVRYGVKTSTSYNVAFPDLDLNQNYKNVIIKENGYFSKITKITNTRAKYVYDITVEDDHSYLTTNGSVHNSVGGSLVAYLLGIHHADPIEYNLIFARFHNKEKKSYPDIDADFATSGRDKVKTYLRQKYGDEYVAHVSNVNTITPKVYARDIARAHEFGSKDEYVQIGNNIADSIPKEIHGISDAFENAPLFAEYAKKYPQLSRYSSISGKYRAWSTHAGGIVISKRPLVGLVPVRRDKDDSLVLEYDKERAEENGLVKMDILGLSTLDVVDKTLDIIKSITKSDIKIPDDFSDSKTYDLISKGDTFCVFQLGTSSGTMDLCRQIKPRSVDDISHVNSLARPSAKDMRSDFIKTKDGKREFSLIHPSLNRAFKSTFGFGLYEESLMYLAQDVAGWSLHEADRLRKLTKEKGKNPKKVAEWRTSFIEGAVKNNIQEEIAKKIWDETVSSFSGYGFNKSHSVMYSMLSYKTAWLKANFPVQFLLANLVSEVKSNALDADKKISKIKKEIRDKKINILPPDINKSLLSYSLIDENNLLTGLDALKFVTDDAIEDILKKRPFNSFFEFMVKVSTSKVRSNTIQALAASGCLDSFNIPRKLIFLYCSDYRKKLGSWLKKHDPSKDQFNYPWPEEKEWDKSELFALENFYLGEGFICQPKDAYKDFFKVNNKNDNYSTVREIKKKNNKDQIKLFKAIVRDCFEFKIKKEGKNYGKIMLKADIEDIYGDICSLTVFPDSYQKIQDVLKLKKNKFKFEDGVGISFSGSVNVYEDETGLVLNDVYDIIPPPQLPLDLKAKKVSIKSINKSVQPSLNEVSKDELFEEIENSLIDEGFVDPDEN